MKRSRLYRIDLRERQKLENLKYNNFWMGVIVLEVLLWMIVFGWLKGHNKTLLQALEEPITINAVEITPTPKKDWDNDLVGYFRYAGERIGYDEYDITKLHGVMDCENEKHTANRKNYLYDGENGHYTAGGFAMITNSTWRQHKCSGSKWDGTDNIDCFYKIIGKNKLSDYKASKSCWIEKFNPNDIVFIKVK